MPQTASPGNHEAPKGFQRIQVPDDIVGYVYEWVAAHIEGRILDGTLPAHGMFPSERHLADLYGVSLGTARHATQQLRRRGLVVTVRSKGTYIAPLDPEKS